MYYRYVGCNLGIQYWYEYLYWKKIGVEYDLRKHFFHCIPILQLTMVVNSYVPTIHIHQPHKIGFEKVIINFTSMWNICKITPQITSWIWKETHWIGGFWDYNILIIAYGAFPKPYFIRTIWFTLKCKLAYNYRTPKLWCIWRKHNIALRSGINISY